VESTGRNERLRLRLQKEQQAVMSWQWIAIAMFIVAVAFETVLCGVCVRWQRESTQYQETIQEANDMRDQAIQALGVIAADSAMEQLARDEQARAYEALGTYTYIGSCKVTAYCCESYEHICGTGDGLTATGIPVTPGIVAVDPEVIPLGSTVVIDGQRYLAADTGGMVKGLHVDIAVPTHEEAAAFGSQVAEVWIIPQEK